MPTSMEKKSKTSHPDQWLSELPIRSEPEGFKPEEMLFCDQCQRKSPPTRLKCFYCGADLKISAEQSKFLKPTLRKLEEWEKGFNLIYVPTEIPLEPNTTVQAAKLLNFESAAMQRFFEIQKSLPLLRLESLAEAEVLSSRLKELDLKTKIVSDESLRSDIFPRRLRRIEFFEDKIVLILFNADEIAEIHFGDLAAIVVGAFFERKIESTESLKKKDERKVLESSEVSADEMLIDIYARQDSNGYRIETKGFDFSSLGSEKSLLAKDNMKTLSEKLRTFSPDAHFDNDYVRIRAELSKIWEVSERNDSSGVIREGMGKFKRVTGPAPRSVR